MQLDERVLVADPLMRNIGNFISGGKWFFSLAASSVQFCEELSENEVDL
jgi:hypothetical protein